MSLIPTVPGFWKSLMRRNEPPRDPHEGHNRMPMKRLHANCPSCFAKKLRGMSRSQDPHTRRAAALVASKYDVPGYAWLIKEQGITR